MVKVNLIGFKELQAKIKKAPAQLKKEVGAEIKFASEDFRTRSIKDAPADTGNLRRQITVNHVGELTSEVISGAEYSAYMEFGTGVLVDVPAGLEEFAAQFNGKGIKQINIRPRPFFFKQIIPVQKKLVDNVENVLKNL